MTDSGQLFQPYQKGQTLVKFSESIYYEFFPIQRNIAGISLIHLYQQSIQIQGPVHVCQANFVMMVCLNQIKTTNNSALSIETQNRLLRSKATGYMYAVKCPTAEGMSEHPICLGE